MKHLIDGQVLVIRGTIEPTRRPRLSVRQRQQPLRVRAHRLIDHRALHPYRSVAAVARRRQGLGDRSGPAHFRLCRTERPVERLDLLRMDRPLAVKPQLTRRARSPSERQSIAQSQERPIDRLHTASTSRRQHRLLIKQPTLDVAFRSAAPECRGQIRVAEDQRAQLPGGAGDGTSRFDAGRRLDQRLQPNSSVELLGDRLQLRGSLHLRNHDRQLVQAQCADELKVRGQLR